MTSYKVPQGTVDAARAILAEGTGGWVHQVHEIVLRSNDPNEDQPMVVRLLPLGEVLGVAITRDGAQPADEDFVFISMRALGNALPALGFTLAARSVPVGYVVHPEASGSAGGATKP